MKIKSGKSIRTYSLNNNFQTLIMSYFKRIVQLTCCTVLLTSCNSVSQKFDPKDLEKFRISDVELQDYISPIRPDGKWGLVNGLGEWIIPAEYEFKPEWIIHDKVILAKGNQKAVYSLDNKPLIPFGDHDISYVRGYTDEDCFFYIRKHNLDDIEYFDLQLNSIPKRHGYDTRNTLRYDYNNYYSKDPLDFEVVNLKGETQLSFKQEEMLCWVGRFSDGMAPFFITKHANVESSSAEPIYYGFINEEGELVIPVQFELLDQDKSFAHELDEYNRIDFEDGKALVFSREGKYFIDKKGKRIKSLPKEVRNVYPVLKDGVRMIDEKLMDSNLNVLFESGMDGWQYNLRDGGYQKFMDNGYCIQHNDSSREFRIVNHKMQLTYKHSFEDEVYIYSLIESNIDSLYWFQREYKDSLNGPLTRYNQGIGVFQGEKRLLSINGKFYSDWVREPYLYNLSLGLKYRWYPKNGRPFFEVRNVNNEIIYECENCDINNLWSERSGNAYRSALVQVKMDEKHSEERSMNDNRDFYKMLSLRHKDYLNLLDPVFYENPGFTLKFDEDDVRLWYKELKVLSEKRD